jgi:predicted Zn-dependent protease with MMP-like domain
LKVSRRHFAEMVDAIAAGVVKSLPDDLRSRAVDIIFSVSDVPTDEQVGKSGGYDDLLGIYEGTPLPERSVDQNLLEPERITIFRINLQEMCGSERELREEIRVTVVHELGHFFGFDEDALENMGIG